MPQATIVRMSGDRFIAADSGVQEACQDKHSQRETCDPKHSFEERPAVLKFRTQKQSEKPGAVTDPNQRAQHARGSEEGVQHAHKHRREGDVGKPLGRFRSGKRLPADGHRMTTGVSHRKRNGITPIVRPPEPPGESNHAREQRGDQQSRQGLLK